MEKVKCALCNLDDYKVILKGGDYRFRLTEDIFTLVECNKCGLIYLNPRPTKEQMSRFYPKQYYDYPKLAVQGYTRLTQALKIRKILKYKKYKKKGRVVDIGCGDGTFLLRFKNKGWETHGIDVSEKACELAKEKLKQDVPNCELKDCHFPDSYFDVIILSHVLEHLHHPDEVIKEVHRILHRDGLVYIAVPNIGSLQFKISKEHWFGLELPRHLYHYTPKTLLLLLEKNKLRVVEMSYPLLDFPLDLFRILKAKWLNGKPKFAQVVLASPLLVVSLLAKALSTLRGSMQVIAQRM